MQELWDLIIYHSRIQCRTFPEKFDMNNVESCMKLPQTYARAQLAHKVLCYFGVKKGALFVRKVYET